MARRVALGRARAARLRGVAPRPGGALPPGPAAPRGARPEPRGVARLADLDAGPLRADEPAHAGRARDVAAPRGRAAAVVALGDGARAGARVRRGADRLGGLPADPALAGRRAHAVRAARAAAGAGHRAQPPGVRAPG